MDADIFKSKTTPPWVNISEFNKWVRSLGFSIEHGERHNRTDGEIDYILKKGNKTININANYWNINSNWQEEVNKINICSV